MSLFPYGWDPLGFRDRDLKAFLDRHQTETIFSSWHRRTPTYGKYPAGQLGLTAGQNALLLGVYIPTEGKWPVPAIEVQIMDKMYGGTADSKELPWSSSYASSIQILPADNKPWAYFSINLPLPEQVYFRIRRGPDNEIQEALYIGYLSRPCI